MAKSKNLRIPKTSAKVDKPWPADAVERWDINRLTPYARNPRTHSADQVKQLVAAIKEWGWTIPILVDEKGMIIAGHGRVMAAEQLGLKDVPVMVAVGWTEAQKRAYVIADNQLAMNAGWDEQLLRLELGSLAKLDFDLNLVGFEQVRLATFMSGNAGESDPDEELEIEAVAVSRPGDVWILGAHRLICGDATDKETVTALLGNDKPHLMVTDPPYGVSYDANWRNGTVDADTGIIRGRAGGTRAIGRVMNDDRHDWREAWELFAGDVAYVWHAGLHSNAVQVSIESAGFQIRSQIMWVKQQFAIGRGDYHWQHEACWYAVRKGKTGHWVGGRKQTTRWDIDKPHKSETGHSTQKPVECMKRPIENNSNAGDFVYEPFAGSGTTIIAAEMTGRKCLAIELNPSYVDLCVRRWMKFTGNKATLQGTKRTFDHIEKERRSAKAA